MVPEVRENEGTQMRGVVDMSRVSSAKDRSTFAGVGIVFGRQDQRLVVTSLAMGGPAEKSRWDTNSEARVTRS